MNLAADKQKAATCGGNITSEGLKTDYAVRSTSSEELCIVAILSDRVRTESINRIFTRDMHEGPMVDDGSGSSQMSRNQLQTERNSHG